MHLLKSVGEKLRIGWEAQHPQSTTKTIVRRLVSRFSGGNPSLAMGNYISEDTINYVRKEVLEHDFRKGK